jgi:hypothetical protein
MLEMGVYILTLLELDLVGRGQFRGQDPWHTPRETEQSMEGSSESGEAEMMGVEQKKRFTQQPGFYMGIGP